MVAPLGGPHERDSEVTPGGRRGAGLRTGAMCGIVIGTKRPRAHSTPRSALSALPTSRRGVYGEQHPVPDGRPAPGRGAGIRTCPADFRAGVRSRRHFSASLGSCLDHGLSPYVAFPFVHSSGTTTCRGHRTSEEQRRCVPSLIGV